MPDRRAGVNQRRELVLETVQAGTSHVGDLARRVGVSERTIRRDLLSLSQQGRLERVHGGAVDADGAEGSLEATDPAAEKKARIGAAAAKLAVDGQTLTLDNGTTTLEIARNLKGRDVTVVTTNLRVYEELRQDPTVELVLSGGIVSAGSESMNGVIAEDSIRQLGSDVAFVATNAIEPDLSIWESAIDEVPLKRAIIDSADRVVVVADSEKFRFSGSALICYAPDVDDIVTDREITKADRIALSESDVKATFA